MANQSTPVPVTGAGAVSAAPCTFRGYAITDTSGANNTIKLYDNASAASGTVLASFVLAANATRELDINDGCRCAKGIYLNSTGSVEGHVRIG